MKWKSPRKIYLYVIYIAVFCKAELIFLDDTCKTACTFKKNLPCKVELYEQCPQRKGVHRYLWPGSPDGVVNSTVYTYSHETNSCNVNYKLSWIPPNDDSGKKVTGFELRIAPNSGPFIGKVECVVFNMEKANWTDADIVSKLKYSFSCFKNLNRGTFAITLYSLPPPAPEGLDKGFMETVHFEEAYYDKSQKKCLINPPLTFTADPVQTTSLMSDENKPPSHSSGGHQVTNSSVTRAPVQQTESDSNHGNNSGVIGNPMIVIYIIGSIAALSILGIVISLWTRQKKNNGYQRLYTDDDFDSVSQLNNGASSVQEPPAGDSVSRLNVKARNDSDSSEAKTHITMYTVGRGSL